MKSIAFICMYILVALSAIVCIAALIMFKLCMGRARSREVVALKDDIYNQYSGQMRSGAEWFLAQSPQEIVIKSYDGLDLFARMLPNRNARGTFILMHGYHGSGLRDFGCALHFFHEQNYNILLPDQRAHGKSEGKYITFGVKERYDCLAWIKFINKKFGQNLPIYLDGLSMGCTTVLMATGLNLPSNVHAIVADCGFTSPLDIIRSVMKNGMHIPSFPLLYTTKFLAKHMAGYQLDEYSTIDALQKNKIPVFFAHGGQDSFVPLSMTLENYSACAGKKHLLIVDNAGHGLSFLKDECRYKRELLDFLADK